MGRVFSPLRFTKEMSDMFLVSLLVLFTIVPPAFVEMKMKRNQCE